MSQLRTRASLIGAGTLVLLGVASVYVVGIQIPVAKVEALERREAELLARIPYAQSIPPGLQAPLARNMIPESDALVRTLGEAPDIETRADLDRGALRELRDKTEALQELRALLRGTYAEDRRHATTNHLTSWLVLRAHGQIKRCAESIVDAARFMEAMHLVGNETSYENESRSLRRLADAVAPCAEASDAETRERAATALEALAASEGVPVYLAQGGISARTLRESLDSDFLVGFERHFRAEMEYVESHFDEWEHSLTARPTQPHVRSAYQLRTLQLRLFAAVFRSHGLQGAEASAAIASLRDPFDGQPLTIDDREVHGRPEGEAWVRFASIRRYTNGPVRFDASTRRNIRSTVRDSDFGRCSFHNRGVQTRVRTRFSIAPDGSVESATATGEPPNETLEDCLVALLRELQFEPASHVRNVSYPFLFRP
ncbi:MAG: hypothetical protein AAGE52_38945 [Myxococcota bacterium]